MMMMMMLLRRGTPSKKQCARDPELSFGKVRHNSNYDDEDGHCCEESQNIWIGGLGDSGVLGKLGPGQLGLGAGKVGPWRVGDG